MTFQVSGCLDVLPTLQVLESSLDTFSWPLLESLYETVSVFAVFCWTWNRSAFVFVHTTFCRDRSHIPNVQLLNGGSSVKMAAWSQDVSCIESWKYLQYVPDQDETFGSLPCCQDS